MSYIRGVYYVWNDDSRLHIWARDGYDRWDESVWNEGHDTANAEYQPSGVAVPNEIADEFAVMRVAQLIDSRRFTYTIETALNKWKDNGGCLSLAKLADRLKQMEAKTDS